LAERRAAEVGAANSKQRIKSQVPKWRTKLRDSGDRTLEFAQSVRAFVKQLPSTTSIVEAVLLGFEQLNFAWDSGVSGSEIAKAIAGRGYIAMEMFSSPVLLGNNRKNTEY
jgi:hypothetical protein